MLIGRGEGEVVIGWCAGRGGALGRDEGGAEPGGRGDGRGEGRGGNWAVQRKGRGCGRVRGRGSADWAQVNGDGRGEGRGGDDWAVQRKGRDYGNEGEWLLDSAKEGAELCAG